MRLSFRRITTGNFIAEIDGLRFIAITGVILFHLNTFLTVKGADNATVDSGHSWATYILSHGHLGVPLFFVISGFILAIPFAKFHLGNGKSVSLKKYFLKRLTRLEPPYLLIMTVLLVGAVYVAKKLSSADGIKSYLASITYTHNFFFPGTLPKLNAVAWSLELEVQFYVLTPLMTYIFSVKSVMLRRLSLVAAIIGITAFNRFNLNPLPFLSLLDYLQYFLAGYLLADIYLSVRPALSQTKFDFILSIISFVLIWAFDVSDFEQPYQKFICELVQIVSIFTFYYCVLFRKSFHFLTSGLITSIGGMCYSVYLLHYSLISLFGNFILKHSFSGNSYVNTFFYYAVLILLILLVSAVFFLLVERPCMNSNWYKKVFRTSSLSTAHYEKE